MKIMTAPTEKLTNILQLEAEKYQDKAVWGGWPAMPTHGGRRAKQRSGLMPPIGFKK
jgi:hypothetical protein